MKIFFLKEHSLYKIFKTLEKIPNKKAIHIYIDPEHTLFENERRGKQIKEILENKKLNVFFITKNDKSRRFFQGLGLNVIHQDENKLIKTFNIFYMFFFNIKKFHLYVYNKKNFIFYLVLLFESLFVLVILYILYTLVLPSAEITITPSHQIENIIYNFRYYQNNNIDYPKNSRFLSIPFYSGYIDYKYDMSISTSQLKHIQNPSKGKVKIFNTTNKEFPIRPNTRLMTNDGRLFQTLGRFTIPAGYKNIPGEIVVNLMAMEKDNDGVYMGGRGNIEKDTILYIRNLTQSYYLKEIYAKTMDNFTGGSLYSEGKVSEKDIRMLSGKLVEYIYKEKQNLVMQNFNIKDTVLLSFNDLIGVQTKEIKTNNKPGEQTPILGGSIVVRLNFLYVKLEDILKATSEYINQRPSEKVKLIKIDQNTLSFFTNSIKYVDGAYIIPTKIDAVYGYDMTKDVNGIVEDIKTKILGKNEAIARDIMLSYPEISTIKMNIRPIWYNEVPKLKSRIIIKSTIND